MIRTVVLALFCCAVINSGVAQSTKKKSTEKPLNVFSVNNKPVTTAEFIYLYSKNPQSNAEAFSEKKILEYLDLLVNFKLKVEEAKRRGLDTTQAFKREFNQYKEELRKPYLPDASLTDSLVKMTYERLKQEVKASHILIKVKPDAAPADTLKAFNQISDIRKKVLAGEDFEILALNFSEDQSAKVNKGSLGYFTALQMVYPFENAAYTTKVGDVSPIVKTQFGYHILKVFDKRPAQGEVEVSHIMIRTGADQDNEKAKNTIFDIYDKLRAGEPWDELCKEFSQDPGSKDTGGKLRPFGIGVMRNVPEFENVAFSLEEPGDLSDPFQTQYGWHIMKLERKIPLASLEDLKASLKNQVARDERTQVSKQALQAKLRKDLQLKEDHGVKAKVLALADSSLAKGKWKAPAFPKASKTVLFSIEKKKYSVQDFLSYAQSTQRPSNQEPQKYLAQLYNNYVDASILDKQEEKTLANNPDYGYLLKEYYEGILLFEIMEDEVWNKASEDSVGQVKYFEAHRQDYQAGERVKATIYSANAPVKWDAIKPVLAQGSETDIQKAITDNQIKYEAGFYKKDDKAILSKIPWSSGMHSAENNGIYYLAWLKSVLPAGNMSFEEARPSVISDYQNFLEKAWVEQLKKKYAVKIDEKGKQHILQKLKK
ncbi:peptidylprolyl isomerase [Pseudochryseolinea flava]|uniref:Peptidylprolyl isomerase n=1 Tax=Pseudochryseolinea flava TaxID=2059302 RepID=A0A364Y902_9BACT|nr:peptidylprolyl isomerase [Pseudochryseolinea flava]RAW03457.1 peptidylprolyl isomerase [Pseudochryseolinea flava]